jgi:hypothetical protein
MSVRFRPGVLAVLMAFAGGLPMALAATSSSSSGKGAVTYRWTDDQGVVHYGDSVPPQYAQKERAVLNSRGVEMRTLDAQKTPEQLAAAERAQQEVLKQKQHDAFLMNTYTSVKDIEALRDTRLDQLHGQRVAAEQYVDSLNSRLSALQTRAKSFKPYNSRPAARRMPDDVAEDLVHTLNELRTQSNVLSSKTEEETSVKAQFQADIERYRELRAKTVNN